MLVYKKMSREKIEFDNEQLHALSRLHMTDEELATYFNCSVKTIQNRKNDDPECARAIELGRVECKMSLRRRQLKLADEGNGTMLIWLGKQYLNQVDKQEIDNYNHNDPISIEIVNPDG